MPKILVVEDDPLVRALALELLQELGLDVDEAGSAAEAAAKIAAGRAQMNAVVVDVGLPDQRGDEFASQLRISHPDLPIIIASGRSEAELRTRFSGDALVGIVSKPYSIVTMQQGLRAIGIATRL